MEASDREGLQRVEALDLEVNVTDLEISYKSKKNLHLRLYSYTIKTFC